MAPKKVTAAQALAETQEGKDAEKPEAAAATSDTPAVAEKPAVDKEIPAIEPIAPVEEGDAGLDDAPRLDPKDLDVQPIAPEEGRTDAFKHYHGYEGLGLVEGDDPPTEEINHDFSWAARQIQNGLRVKRDAWIGNKFIDASHRAGKHILLSEDMLATDWIVI